MLSYMEAFAVFAVHDDLSTLQHFFMSQPACRQEVAATSWWSQLTWVHLWQRSGWRLRKPVWPYLRGLTDGNRVGVVCSLKNSKKKKWKKKNSLRNACSMSMQRNKIMFPNSERKKKNNSSQTASPTQVRRSQTSKSRERIEPGGKKK